MAKPYHLICFDCKLYLSLGGLYWRTQQDEILRDPTVAGIQTVADDFRHRRDELFAHVIEKFLIIHRNHELRFVPEGVDELLEATIGYVAASWSEDILDQKVDPFPDPYQEYKDWETRIKGSMTSDKQAEE